MFIQIAHAASHVEPHVASAQGFLMKINENFLYPLITLMMAVAVLVFLYGCFEYVRNSTSEEGRATGQRHIMWGIIGLLIMTSAYAILAIAAGTFGLGDDLERANTPFSSSVSTEGMSGAPSSGSGTVGPANDNIAPAETTSGSAESGTYVINGTDYTYFYNELIKNGADETTADNTVKNLQYIPQSVVDSSYSNEFISDSVRDQLLVDLELD